jgi:hypothetical protein
MDSQLHVFCRPPHRLENPNDSFDLWVIITMLGNFYIAMEHHHFHGKIHDFYGDFP